MNWKPCYIFKYDSKTFKPFLNGAKLPELRSKYFLYRICQKFVDLFTKNMNGWSHKKIILYLFCSFDLLRKKVENNFFMRAALLCANISQIFFSQFHHQKYLRCLLKSLFNWSPHFFTSFSKPARTPTDSSTADISFQLVPKYMLESETDQMLFPKYLIWNNSYPQKWGVR